MLDRLNRLYYCGIHVLHCHVYFLTALFLRFALALPFWRSGQNKVEGFAFDPLLGRYQFDVSSLGLSENSLYLFMYEFNVPLLPPYLAAVMAATGEIILPVLLILGLFTRFAAAGLLAMTAVIQFFVLPGSYDVHATWAALAMTLMTFGGGTLSLDAFFTRKRQAPIT